MPVTTGLLFLPVLLVPLFMLYHVLPPTEDDIASRTKRAPMDKAERRKFIRSYFPGVLLLMLGYLCLMTYRDLRDSFMDKILTDLNYTVDSSTFARIESWVGVAVILILCPIKASSWIACWLPFTRSRRPVFSSRWPIPMATSRRFRSIWRGIFFPRSMVPISRGFRCSMSPALS